MPINQITIEGNVGSDPEIKFTQDDAYASFSLANTPWSKTKGEGETMWFRVTFWNKKAELLMDTVKKGDKVLIVGTFKSYAYQDKEGNSKTALEINGTEFALMPRNVKNSAPVASTTEAAPW